MIRKLLFAVVVTAILITSSALPEGFAEKAIAAKPAVKSVKLLTGVKLEYAEQGDSSGLPVILLHGYTDSWRSFELVLPQLPSTLRAFALTQRGHGDSERPATGYSLKDFSEDVLAFMDAMKLKRAVIAGHSMGSQVALRFVLDHPDRASGLLLVGAFKTVRGHVGVKELWDTTISKLADPVDKGFAREFQQSTLHKPIPATFLDAAVQESAKVPARVWRSALAGLMETDFSSEFTRIKLPTLIVWGDQDLFCSRTDQDYLTTAIQGARLLVYSGTGHAPHWEEPERFAADVTSFVEKLTH